MTISADVSRETMDRLKGFESLVRKWSPKINLVAPSTLDQLWQRHIEDSAQLYTLVRKTGSWLDIGSGGGFPGMVCRILAAETEPDRPFSFIESDTRKCVFLRTAIRELGLNGKVFNARIEKVSPQNAAVVSARALAPLDRLLPYVARHLAQNGTALLQKGNNWQSEVQSARKTWHFDCEAVESKTEQGAVILKISKVQHG